MKKHEVLKMQIQEFLGRREMIVFKAASVVSSVLDSDEVYQLKPKRNLLSLLPRETLFSDVLIYDKVSKGSYYWAEDMKYTAEQSFYIGISGASRNNLEMTKYGLWGTFNLPNDTNFVYQAKYGYTIDNYIYFLYEKPLKGSVIGILARSLGL